MHQAITEVLQRAGALLDAAETHGVLCGFLCSGAKDNDERWLKAVFGENEFLCVEEKYRSVLLNLKNYLQDQLDSPDFIFTPLLPSDNQPLETRVAALSGWSEGFLLGLGISDLRNQRLSAENQEFIADVLKFSKLSIPVAENEIHEQAYMELVEYLRVGVLNLYYFLLNNI